MVLPLNQILARAWDATTKPMRYYLGAGGRDPSKATCATVRDGITGSDCVGFVMWALGIDRYQPSRFGYYGGWMNTDSVIYDATDVKGRKTGFSRAWDRLSRPEPGALVIFPSLYKNGKRTRIGHVGLIVEVPAEWPDNLSEWSDKERRNLLNLVKVIDCNASLARRLKGKAIGMNTMGALWSGHDVVIAKPREGIL